jgi:hypothetical protein
MVRLSADGESSVSIGDRFEDEVASALRLMAGATVEQRIRLDGKVVDIVLTIRGRLGSADERVAVECKDYSRRINRDQMTDFLKDYYPLLNKGTISAVIIVTRNGINENAADCLDGQTTRHLTYSQILRQILDLSPLAHEMRQQFFLDSLNEYYEPLQVFEPNYELVKARYKWYVNPFIDFVISSGYEQYVRSGARGLDELKAGWRDFVEEAGRPEFAPFADVYYPSLLQEIVEDRVAAGVADLHAYIQRWLADPTAGFQIALLGSYGTGKSTYARHLAYRCAMEYEQGQSTRVPLLIELRRFSADQDIEGLITHELANRNCVEGATFTRFQLLNRLGAFVLILDGLDEMKYGMSREALAHNLEEINRLAIGQSKVILCGRPTLFADALDQYALLQGVIDVPLMNRVTYLPIKIAPLQRDRIVPMAAAYAKACVLDAEDDRSDRISELKRAMRRGSSLPELLSRPVHIPMLLRVLPQLDKGALTNLNRGELYLHFVRLTIERESRKRRLAGSPVTSEQRLDFAARLACEMTKQGDTRKISASSIPNELYERYSYPGRSIEITRNDMRSACFLEQKPPDILYFGHKSYCEFLAALHLIQRVRDNESTNGLGPVFSPEVLSFFLALARPADLREAGKCFPLHWELVDRASVYPLETKFEGEQRRLLAKEVIEHGASYFRGRVVDKNLVNNYVRMCKRFKLMAQRTPAALQALFEIVRLDENVMAIEALLLLPKKLRPSRSHLKEILGDARFAAWQDLAILKESDFGNFRAK